MVGIGTYNHNKRATWHSCEDAFQHSNEDTAAQMWRRGLVQFDDGGNAVGPGINGVPGVVNVTGEVNSQGR